MAKDDRDVPAFIIPKLVLKIRHLVINQSGVMETLSAERFLVAGSIWAFVGRAVASVTGLTVNALLTRLLPPDQVGAYFLVISVVSTAALFGRTGLGRTAVRLIAEEEGRGEFAQARATAWAVMRLGTASALAIAFLYLVFGDDLATNLFHSDAIASVVPLAALLIVTQVLEKLLAETFRGFQDIRSATLFEGPITKLLLLCALAGFWFFGRASLNAVLFTSAAAGGMSVIFASLLMHRRLSDMPCEAVVSLRPLFGLGSTLFLTELTYFILTQLDLWILGAFCAQEEIAIYGAAVRLVALVVMPLTVINTVVPPLIARMWAEGRKQQLEDALRKTATIAGLPAFIVLLVLVIGGRLILKTVYGAYYEEGAMVLSVLAAGQLANAWAGSCGLTLMMTGNQLLMMVIGIASSIVTAAIALAAVPEYGMIGVAAGASSGLILQNILMWWGAHRRTGIRTHVRLFAVFDLIARGGE